MNLYKLEVKVHVLLWNLLLLHMHRPCGFKEEFPCQNATWEMLIHEQELLTLIECLL